MNIRDEELVQRYFERSMSSAEEQNFLIDVAARDDMRMAFRSQLELLKTIKFDKDVIGGTGLVRERTLAALGLTAALVSTTDESAVAATPSFIENVRSFLAKPYTLLLAGIAAGGLTTYALMPTSESTSALPQRSVQEIVAPTTTQPQVLEIVTPEIRADVTPAETKREVVTKPIVPARTDAPEVIASEPPPVVNTNGVTPVIKNTLNIRKPSEVK